MSGARRFQSTVSTACSLLALINENGTVRWNPRQQNAIFFHQSAMLNCVYHLAQLTIHRPVLPDKPSQRGVGSIGSSMILSKSKPHAMAEFAVDICTSAARTCARIMHEHALRKNGIVPTHIVKHVFAH